MICRVWLTSLLVVSLVFCSTPTQAESPEVEPLPRVPATSPAEAAATIHLQDGFRAELIAAEPLVTDPIAMTYDENGRAYVVEMNDYPYSDKSHDQAWQEQTSEPIGRIRLLEDTDGDGKFDRSTVFADKLSWPSGVAVWKGGVYVTATPDVWYFKDTDGDGRADVRRKIFKGFRKYNVQAVMNNLQWGLDHRIYAAGSSNGGNIEPACSETSQEPTRIGRNDFRFDPRVEQFEAISGGARFGHTHDDWGNRFLCDIRNPVQQVILPARYLRRNRYLPVASTLQDVAESGDAIAVFQISPPEPWRVINAQRRAADTATKSPFDSTVAKGYVTSSSGVTIYRGAAYPEEYYGDAFIGEVAGNLVMRYKLTPEDVSFTGKRVYPDTEFLASTDNWFRPVNFVNAPDGTLHVLDMYRETIEHPWSMPDDLKARVDLTSGRDRGRIYRLLPSRYRPGFTPPPAPRLGDAQTAELVTELENPNSWWRETAHRLIFERQDATVVPQLRKLLRESSSAVGRLHALWSLDGLQALDGDDLHAALSDSDPHIREHAVLLAEPRLVKDSSLLEQVLTRATDESPRVRFQVALTLGEVDDPRATMALGQIARRDSVNKWTLTAVLSSLPRATVPFLLDVLADEAFAREEAGRAIVAQLSYIVGARNEPQEIDRVLQAAEQVPAVQRVVAENLGAGLKRNGGDLDQIASDPNRTGSQLVSRLLTDARRQALDTDAPQSTRLEAIELLSYGGFTSVQSPLTELLGSRHPPTIQSAAIRALTSFPNSEIAGILLEKHSTLTPAVQAELVDRLMTRTVWIPALLDAVAAGVVPASRIADVRRDIYKQSCNPNIRDRALRLFSGDVVTPRATVIAEYQPALSLASDPLRGEQIFRRECANCHRLNKHGHEVGPNLATIQNRSPEQLLVNLLDPSREVAPNFLEYIVVMNDGRISTGVIASETATSITLRQPEGKQLTVLREDIDIMRNSGKSLMPEGLEKKLTPQHMADLIAYLLPSTKTRQ